MPTKIYIVNLTLAERNELLKFVSTGNSVAKSLQHARILLLADQGLDRIGSPNQEISDMLHVSLSTILRVRQRFVEEGLQAALERKKHIKPPNQKFDGDKEAHLIALACSAPPEGRLRWTLALLADKMVECNFFEDISGETIRLVLKKTNLNLG